MKLKGRDGVEVTIPAGAHGVQGPRRKNGRYPKRWPWSQGRDSRMVAIKPGGHGLQGRDGRMAAFPKWGHGLHGRDVTVQLIGIASSSKATLSPVR